MEEASRKKTAALLAARSHDPLGGTAAL